MNQANKSNIEVAIARRIANIYGDKVPKTITNDIVDHILKVKDGLSTKNSSAQKWTEKDTILITYGDSLRDMDEMPLETLQKFLIQHLSEAISIVHILPFFPYSSDDGFSVIDYLEVNPELGNWDDIKKINQSFRLMFDLVINHISQFSTWFQNYRTGREPGKSYFIEQNPSADLSAVVRPRSLPLLTKVQTTEGEKHVWTTFSADQVDLNFSNPALLTEMIKVFLFYLEKGAQIIRLDAIAFLWKEIGTNCLHLPQTHEVVKLMRDIMDILHPSYILLTETNVPNKENLSYFGQGDEANMVYQFSLPPLLLHALHTGNSTYLQQWARNIPQLENNCSFFNFTASHDGIGVRPLEGLVPEEEFQQLVEGMRKFGAHISTKRNSDGSDSPYEMNITYLDALRGTSKGRDTYQFERFICSQTIMMSLQGVPAFYIHSLLGTRNYTEGVLKTGMPRTINRRKWHANEIYPLLKAQTTLQGRIFTEMKNRIALRRTIEEFHPNKPQKILECGSDFFVLSRNNDKFFSICNITDEPRDFQFDPLQFQRQSYTDLLGNVTIASDNPKLTLKPYQCLWLKEKE